MRTWTRRNGRSGFSVIEIMSVAGVIALLLGLGFTLQRSIRAAAAVTVAESDLKQIGTAMELYFRQYGSYPPQGCDLVAALTPFVGNPDVFKSPLLDEATPGQTISDLYRAPTSDELDRPNIYLTAMVSDNGHTSVVLRTGQVVERHDDILFNPNDPRDFHASLSTTGDYSIAPPTDGSDGSGGSGATGDPPPTPPEPTGTTISGSININPRNNEDFEFSMTVPAGSHWSSGPPIEPNPDGQYCIGRDDLITRNTVSRLYSGLATQIRLCPKGNGNQNSITVNGEPLRNGTLYIITCTAGTTMTVTLRNTNAHSNGKAMGKWWIDITASSGTVTASAF